MTAVVLVESYQAYDPPPEMDGEADNVTEAPWPLPPIVTVTENVTVAGVP